jgi:hypothetical protein
MWEKKLVFPEKADILGKGEQKKVELCWLIRLSISDMDFSCLEITQLAIDTKLSSLLKHCIFNNRICFLPAVRKMQSYEDVFLP